MLLNNFFPSSDRSIKAALLFGTLALACVTTFVAFAMRAPQSGTEAVTFSIEQGHESHSEVLRQLYERGFVRHPWALSFALMLHGRALGIAPGGYSISSSDSAWKIAGVLSHSPNLVWVLIPEGLRKEEVAEILAKDLKWDAAQKNEWLLATNARINYTEGVYFPDTYLIPENESPAQVVERMQAHFEEKFQSYAKEALNQNMKWTTALKVASLIQREAASAKDMPIISGIIWNRLEDGMGLDIDATLQYITGDEKAGWWHKVSIEDKKIDSPYNTYKYNGLPPTPIANPGLAAIKAALFPAETNCLYYLHDSSGAIHCAGTYAGQKENVERYLK